MDTNFEETFDKIISKYENILLRETSISPILLSKIKKDLRKNLDSPPIEIFKKDLAKFFVKYLIKKGIIDCENKYQVITSQSGFLFDNLDEEEVLTLFEENKELIINKNGHNTFAENNDDLDELNSNDIEIPISQKLYLKDDPNWFANIGLTENPFPSLQGLHSIPEAKYDNIVLKTPLFLKYLEILEKPTDILNRSVVICGDFGCGKTSFFDYLEYKLLLNNIQPIRIILSAKPTLDALIRDFEEALYEELRETLNRTIENTEFNNITEINKYRIKDLFINVQKMQNRLGFVIFLDGLHKSQDEQSTAFKFVTELQNILEFYRMKKICISIFVAGTNDWKNHIQNSKITSGSIFDTDSMGSLNEAEAFEMLNRRFRGYCLNSEKKNFMKYEEIKILVNTIEKTLASEVTFRILIKYFRQNGFIFKNRVKVMPYIGENTLFQIYERIKDNKLLFNELSSLKKCIGGNNDFFLKYLNLISRICEIGYIFEEDNLFRQNESIFNDLIERGIIVKRDKFIKKNIIPWGLNELIDNTFWEIKKQMKLHPSHYLELLFSNDYSPKHDNEEYMAILDTIKRFIVNNPEYKNDLESIINLCNSDYFTLIRNLESSLHFEINQAIITQMNTIIEKLLRFIYNLSQDVYSASSQQEIFNIFRYTWLDNETLHRYFTIIDNFNSVLSNSSENKQILKQFIDTFDSLIEKIGKHLRYNKIIIIGSKDLNNQEKNSLNDARGQFGEQLYQKAIQSCHDEIEKKVREFITNILLLKYGVNWRSQLPKHQQVKIANIQKKEVKNFGQRLTEDGKELQYVSRGDYSYIFNDEILWKSCFKPIIGEATKDFLRENLILNADLGHLDKHNRTDEELKKISYLVEHRIKRTRDIFEIINRSYRNLIEGKFYLIENNSMYFKFDNEEIIENLNGIQISEEIQNKILQNLIHINISQTKFYENYIDISNQKLIRDLFAITYPEFIVNLLNLIATKKISISDYFGSSIKFERIPTST
jgi:hypothetical protein